MTATEILQSVQFVVDQSGKPTAAMLDMRAWEAFLSIPDVGRGFCANDEVVEFFHRYILSHDPVPE